MIALSMQPEQQLSPITAFLNTLHYGENWILKAQLFPPKTPRYIEK